MTGPALVTGAAGFAGSHLLDQLEGTCEVVAWRRPDDPLPSGRSGTELRWMAIDVLDRDRVRAGMAEVRPAAIYHCAGVAHLGESWGQIGTTLAVNVLGTHHVLEAAARLDVPARILVPGSSYVYRAADRALHEGDPVGPSSPYALSKLAQEMVAHDAWRDAGVQTFLTRSFNHIGPRQAPSFFASGVARRVALIEAGQAEPTIEVGNLAARRDLTDVRDTVRAYRLIVERGRPGEIYNVCSGRAVEIGHVLERLVASARIRIAVRVDPARFRPHDAPLVAGSPARVQALGWEPHVPFDQTLEDLLAWWRGEVAAGRAGNAAAG